MTPAEIGTYPTVLTIVVEMEKTPDTRYHVTCHVDRAMQTQEHLQDVLMAYGAATQTLLDALREFGLLPNHPADLDAFMEAAEPPTKLGHC